MAFLATNPSDLDEEERRRQQESGGGIPGGDIGSSGTGATGAAPSGGPGTGFTNLRTYLDANQGQGKALSEKIAGQLGEAADTFKTDVTKAGDAFKSEADAAAVRTNQDVISRAGANTAEFVKNPNDVSAFTKMRDASYKGPARFEDSQPFGDLSARLAGLEAKGKLADTEEGRLTLLNDLNPVIGKGKQNFDNLLLSGDPTARETLTSAAAPYAGLRSFLDSTAGGANTAADQARADTEAAKAAAKGVLSGRDTMEADLTNRAATKRTAAEERLARQQAALQSGQISSEDLVGLGEGTPEDLKKGLDYGRALQSVYGRNFDPSSLFTVTGSPGMITPETVATPEEYAKYLALSQLSGADPTLLSPTNQGQAGTATDDFADLDFGRLRGLPGEFSAEDQALLERTGARATSPQGGVGYMTTRQKQIGTDVFGNPIWSEPFSDADLELLRNLAQRGLGNLPPGEPIPVHSTSYGLGGWTNLVPDFMFDPEADRRLRMTR